MQLAIMKKGVNLTVLEMPANHPEIPLRSDAGVHPAPDEHRRDYVDKMLLAALQEAQSTVRSYDTKAQIVGAGYILALNLVLHFGDLLPTRAPLGPLFFAVVWGVIMMPILQFGQVLYPCRVRAEKDDDATMAQKAATEDLKVLKPDLATKPRVWYRGLEKWETCFIGGSVSAEIAGVVDCVEGAEVSLSQGSACIARTLTDSFGDFRFDNLADDGRTYRVEVSHAHGSIGRDCTISESVYLGELRLTTLGASPSLLAG